MKRSGFEFFCLVCLLCCFADKLIAQTSDTIQLNTISIVETRPAIFTVGQTVTLFDSATLQNSVHKNLGELLSSSSTVFIKTYGSGGSATLSSRGTEARHSAILWNGFNINSSSLGLTDLSLVPVSIAGNIRLIHGGSSPVNGNSALGSTVILEQNEPRFIKNFNLFSIIEAGSFGNKHITVGNSISSHFIESKTVLFGHVADNNFKYINDTHRDKPLQTLQNAAFENFGFTQDFHFKIKSNQIIAASLWYQVNEREIPPMMTDPKSVAIQKDSLLRIFIGYSISKKKSAFKINVGYFNEHQFYDDAEHNLDLRYQVINYLSEFEWRYNFNENLFISNGVAYTNSVADIKEYESQKNRYQASFFSNIHFNPFRGWKFNAGIRQEIATEVNPPLSPSVGLEGLIYKNIIVLTANAGRHYNLPGMNDLYWVPGGNPDLKPEQAWSYEAGLTFMKNHPKYPAVSFVFYNAIVDNWIKWQPVSGGYYSPDNLRQVKTSGFETKLNYQKKISAFNFNLNLNYAYTKSVLSESDDPFSEEIIGKQLMYIPLNIFNGVMLVSYKTFSIQYTHTYTGERFTTADNSKQLPGYHLADLTFNNSFLLKRNRLDIFFKILNLYDTTYQTIAYRPEPGRWFSGGVKINFNLTSNSIQSK